MTAVRYFFAHWQNWLGLGLVLFFVVVAVLAPILSPYDPRVPGPFKKVGVSRGLGEMLPPNDVAILGTLPGGYDVFHSLVWGTRSALSFGLTVTILSALFGVLYGAVSGYAGDFVNRMMMRITDAFLAFPVIAGVVFLEQLLAVAIKATGGMYVMGMTNINPALNITPPDVPILALLQRINPLMISLILFSWMPYARMVNSMVLGVKNAEFVQAARVIGASPWRIIRRHLLPNSLSPAIVLAARDVGSVVLFQATLTFINIGGDSPWGEMLAIGRNWVIGPGGSLFDYWWVYIPATLAVVLFGISWNLLGDGLTDVMDPYEVRT